MLSFSFRDDWRFSSTSTRSVFLTLVWWTGLQTTCWHSFGEPRSLLHCPGMTSIAPSKWSMSVHGDDRKWLKARLYTSRFYYLLSIPVIALYGRVSCLQSNHSSWSLQHWSSVVASRTPQRFRTSFWPNLKLFRRPPRQKFGLVTLVMAVSP
jgi:hypothetical protein